MIKRIAYISCLVLLVISMRTVLFAEQLSQKGSVSKEIGGRVSGISKDYIAVTYHIDEAAQTEYEVLLPLDKKITLEHIKALDQVKEGDTVAVQFEEYTEMTKDGPKTFRKAKGISFISAAPKETESDVLGAQ